RSELVMKGEFVDLDDDSVDLVLDTRPVFAEVLDESDHAIDVLEDAVVARGRQPPSREQLVHLGLGRDGRLWPGADSVHQHPEPAETVLHQFQLSGVLALSLLAEAAARSVAGVGEDLLTGSQLTFVELAKGLDREKDLTPHFDERGVAGSGQLLRNGVDG